MDRRLLIAAGLALAPLAAHTADPNQRKKGGGDSFIEIDTLTATIVRANGMRGVMTVEAGVDVPDLALRARAEASTPLLRSAFDEIVRTYATGMPPGTVPNADYLSRELQRQTDIVLGRPGGHLLLGTILVN